MKLRGTREEPTSEEWEEMVAAARAVARRLAPSVDHDEVESRVGAAVTATVTSGTWNQIESPAAWVTTVAVRCAADLHTARLRREEALDKLRRLRPQAATSYPATDTVVNDFWRSVVRETTYAQSRILYLSYLDFTDGEIADYLGIHRGTVARHAHDGRKRLRQSGLIWE